MIFGTLYFDSRVRDDEIVPLSTTHAAGFTSEPPTVGDHFTMFAEPTDKIQHVRFIRTTRVILVEGNKFHTTNSIYRWESK